MHRLQRQLKLKRQERMQRKTEQNGKFVAIVENLTYPPFKSIEEVLTSLQTSWGLFSEIWPTFGII